MVGHAGDGGRPARTFGVLVGVLVALLLLALATSALIGRVTATSRHDAAQVLAIESVRRIAAEQRALEREAALSGAAPQEVLDRFALLREEMDTAFAQLEVDDGDPGDRRSAAARSAASYQHVLAQQLQLLHDGYVSSAVEFGETRVRTLGATLTDLLSAEQAERLARAEEGARQADRAILLTLLVGAGLLGAAVVALRRAQGSQLATREAATRAADALGRHASDLVAVVDPAGIVRHVGASTELLVKSGPEALVGRQVVDLVHTEERAAVTEALRAAAAGSTSTVQARFGDGAVGWRHLDLTVSDGTAEVGGVVINGHDVTVLTDLQQQLQHQATHDGLTGLPNRSKLDHDATRVLRASTPVDVALLLFDLDDFKHINDTLGHAAGDVMLLEAAARLGRVAPPGSTPARLGGDEFALLLPGAALPDAIRIAREVVDAVSAPVQLGGQRVAVGCSVGLAAVTPEARDVGSLLQHADAAMYAAKRAGKNRMRTFAPWMLAAAARRMHVLADLREAVDRDQLVLHFQPIVSLATGRVTHVEALARWQHPERGLLPPSEFIPVAEESGLILPIGRWVLRSACEAAVRWQAAQGDNPVGLAVNLSPRELTEPGFCAEIAGILAETGLPPHLLTLEVTEHVLIGDLDELLVGFATLAALGIRLAIDDFGTGYSSLQHLRRFPFHTLKIAGEFVAAAADGGDGEAFLAAIVQLAHTVGLETVAEGVEGTVQLSVARSLGCTSAQGVHVAEAMPLEALQAFLGLYRQVFRVASRVRPESDPGDEGVDGGPRVPTAGVVADLSG